MPDDISLSSPVPEVNNLFFKEYLLRPAGRRLSWPRQGVASPTATCSMHLSDLAAAPVRRIANSPASARTRLGSRPYTGSLRCNDVDVTIMIV